MLTQLPIQIEDTSRSHAEAVARNRREDAKAERIGGLRSAIAMYEKALKSGICPFSKAGLTAEDRIYFQNAIKQWGGELSRLVPTAE